MRRSRKLSGIKLLNSPFIKNSRGAKEFSRKMRKKYFAAEGIVLCKRRTREEVRK